MFLNYYGNYHGVAGTQICKYLHLSRKVTVKKNWRFRIFRKGSLILMTELIMSREGGEVASLSLFPEVFASKMKKSALRQRSVQTHSRFSGGEGTLCVHIALHAETDSVSSAFHSYHFKKGNC